MKRIHKIGLASIATLVVVVIGFTGFSKDLAFRLAQPETQLFNANDLASGQVREIRLGKNYRVPYIKIRAVYTMLPAGDGYPNLFQTADGNAGVRMEFNGRNVGMVYAAAGATPYHVILLPLLSTSKRFYRIDIEAANGEFINVSLDGDSAVQLAEPRPAIAMSRVLVGQGFDSSREFTGTVREFELIAVEYRRYQFISLFIDLMLCVIYLAILSALKIIPTTE